MRDIASAKEFSTPGMCTAQTSSWCWALMKNKHLRMCIIWGTGLYPELMTDTAPMLSQWNVTVVPVHLAPHTAHARTIGSSSLSVMLSSRRSSCPGSVPLRPCQLDPFTSVYIETSTSKRSRGIRPNVNARLCSRSLQYHACPVPCLQEQRPPH